MPSRRPALRSLLLTLLVALAVLSGGAEARAQVSLPSTPEDVAPEETPAPIDLEAPSDSALAERLRSVFGVIDEFENVSIAVQSGVVRLSGTVADAEARAAAAELAERFDGAVFVDNDVTTDTAVEVRLSPVVQRLRSIVDSAGQMLPLALIALVVFLLFWGMSRLLGAVEAPARWSNVSPLMWSLVRRVLRALLLLAGLLLALDVLGVSSLVGAVLGTAGIVGIALGFAFQDIVENYLAGALLSIRHPFAVNDLVGIGDHEGSVVRLTSRELILLTLDGNHVRLPNATVFKSVLVNYTRNPTRRFEFDIGVGSEEDLERAEDVGVETLRALRGVIDEPPPFALVMNIGDSSVVVRYHGWVDQRTSDFMKVRSESIRLVKEALEAAGVELPEPIHRVRVERRRETPPSAGGAEAEAASAPRSPEAVRERAARADTASDGRQEALVRQDLARSGEANLLDKGARAR